MTAVKVGRAGFWVGLVVSSLFLAVTAPLVRGNLWALWSLKGALSTVAIVLVAARLVDLGRSQAWLVTFLVPCIGIIFQWPEGVLWVVSVPAGVVYFWCFLGRSADQETGSSSDPAREPDP